MIMKWKIGAFRIKYNIYKPYPEKHMALQKSYACKFQKGKQHIKNYHAGTRGIQEPETVTGVWTHSECCSEHS